MNTLYLVAINLWIIALHIVDGEILFNSTVNLANEVHSQCSINSLYSWQCDSGQCIEMDELCDGIKNCDDGTDETVEHCLHKACPSYAFKCTYGGCIPGNYRCNGISDCWDGSDENRFMCNYSLNYTQEIRGDCWLSSQMQCQSGECISNEGVCDGVPNCKDGSDETVDICSFFNCPEYAFRCGYGACVAGSARCNGVKDCLDGSDEFADFCAIIIPINLNETLPQRPDYVPGGMSTTYKPPIAQTTTRRVFNSTVNLANEVHSQCSINSLYSWQCDSGQCIEMDELCDGNKNCDDGTDETVEHCLHKACPSYAFQCTYGGCIPGNYRCNGISDCWDGSDENRFMCNYSLNYTQEIRGDCWLSSQMQCKSGECISNEGVCDGVPNCKDGSDETVDICSFFNCPEYAFRCGYGACVAGSARCNGVKDCLDGSDEFADFCATIVPINLNVTLPQRPDYVPSVPGGMSTTYKPPIAQTTTRRGMYTTYKSPSRTTTVRPTPVTSTTESFIDVRFSGDKYIYCKTNTLRRGISTIASCSYNNQNVSCYDNVRLNTTAHLSCATGYTMSEQKRKQPTTIICDFDGEWTHSDFKCSPRCGELTPKQKISLIKPWDVTIFKRSDTPTFHAICSGVIVSPNIVITVANCLPTTANGYNTNRTLYNVVEGYHNFSYLGGDVLRKGVHKIQTIKIITRSNVEAIALFVLEDPFQLSHSLKPVCLPTTHRMSLSNGNGPISIGRGVTHETSREYLEKLIQSTIIEDSGESKTYIQYMRIQKFVSTIKREITSQTHLL